MRDKAYENIIDNQLSEEFNLGISKKEDNEENSCY